MAEANMSLEASPPTETGDRQVGFLAALTPKQIFDSVAHKDYHDVTYWKACTVALSMENKRLKELLRNVLKTKVQSKHYNQTTIHKVNAHDQEFNDEEDEEYEEDEEFEEGEYYTNGETSLYEDDNKSTVIKKQQIPVINNIVAAEEMSQKLYGVQAPKIRGMEAALQVNYDRNIQISKYIYWPNIPLNLNYS